MHPVGAVITDALGGRFPPVDGSWQRVAPWRAGVEAVVAFTGHAVLAIDPAVPVEPLVLNGYGGATDPRVVVALAGSRGWIDSLDVLLATRATTTARLVDRPDRGDHPRVALARRLRTDVRVLGRPDPSDASVATLARGIGGLWEISVELAAPQRGHGEGATFVQAAVAAAPPGEVVVAAVAPGNAASVRSFLGAGFQVLGSVQLFRPER